jgi:hypothetical protein
MNDDVFHLHVDAPVGQIWVCCMCGKTSKNRAGTFRASPGWDESCMVNAILCFEEKGPEGQWRAVPE